VFFGQVFDYNVRVDTKGSDDGELCRSMHFSFSRATYLAHVIFGLIVVSDCYVVVMNRRIAG
jgi:hypothetical protein